jgi:hypothetical protein
MRKISVSVFIAAVFVLCLDFEGCGPNATNPFTPLKSGEIQATISGLGQFYATDAQVTEGPTTYFIAASLKDKNGNDSLVIHILVPKQTTLPYTIDVSNDDVAVMDYCITTSNGCVTYQTKKSVGSGTVKITDVSPTVQGTFSGTLPAETGSGSVTISNGAFNASF